ITSVFGQRIRLIRTDGTWVSNLRFEHVAYIERRIDWGQQYSKCPYIEWMIRSWAIDRLQSVIDTRPLVEILHRISTFDPKGKRAETLAAELYEWLVEQILTCTDEAAPQVVLGCRTLYLWALEEDLPGFNELQYEDLMGHRLARK